MKFRIGDRVFVLPARRYATVISIFPSEVNRRTGLLSRRYSVRFDGIGLGGRYAESELR